jgi:hypothetical protein
MYGFGPDHRKQGDECQANQKNPKFDVFSDHRRTSPVPIIVVVKNMFQ